MAFVRDDPEPLQMLLGVEEREGNDPFDGDFGRIDVLSFILPVRISDVKIVL